MIKFNASSKRSIHGAGKFQDGRPPKSSGRCRVPANGPYFSAAITLLCTQVVMKHRLPFAIEAAGALAAPSKRNASGDSPFKTATSIKNPKGQAATPGERFLDFVREHPIDVPEDFKWSRTEANERKMRWLPRNHIRRPERRAALQGNAGHKPV